MSEELQKTSGLSVELPGGYIKDGEVHKDADVVGINGYVRRQMLARKTRTKLSRIADTLITNCVTRLGSLEKVSVPDLTNLLMGDRDFLFLQIRKATLGEVVTVKYQCDNCAKAGAREFDIGDIPITPLNEDRVEIGADGRYFTKLVSKEHDIDLTIRLPVHGDIKRHEDYEEQEINHRILESNTIELNGDAGIGKAGWPDSMSLPRLNWIIHEMISVGPYVDMVIEIECDRCGTEGRALIDYADFLELRPTREVRTS